MHTYGIISDIHRAHPGAVKAAIQALKDEGAKSLVLNGDIDGDQFEGLRPDLYLGYILGQAVEAGLETFVQPGSHEEVQVVEPVIKHMAEKHPSIIYTVDEPQIDTNGHHLVFMPGSDWRFGPANASGFALEKSKQKSGVYENGQGGEIRLINMDDLKSHVEKPEKTILFCHVPRKFSNVDTGVDYAHFLNMYNVDLAKSGTDEFMKFTGLLPGVAKDAVQQQRMPVMPYMGRVPTQDELVGFARTLGGRLGMRFQFVAEVKDNRGNKDLEEIANEVGIQKFISGHFHESVGRATDAKGNPVPQNTKVNNLFWNASYMDAMKVGLLTVDDAEVAYENVEI